MATAKLFNLARMSTATTGTGTITLGSAVAGFLSFATAGVANGDTVTYAIKDGANSEIGRGVYTATGTTLSRSVLKSTNANAAISLSGAAEVFITAAAEDFLREDLLGITSLNSGPIAGFRNRLINGEFGICQRNGTTGTTTADNGYWADRWRYVGEASATLTAIDTGGATNGVAITNGKLLFTGTTDKGGIWQIIEGKNCKDLRGRSVTFSVRLAVNNATLGNVKMGIVEFTGTEDSVSGDPISVWGADGTTPTLAASYAFLNIPANLSVTTSMATYTVTATVGASANNLAVFIWNDDKTYSASDYILFTTAQLEAGATATTFERRPYGAELALAQRYFQFLPKWFGSWQNSATIATLSGAFPVPMRTNPSATLITGTSAVVHPGVAFRNVTAIAVNNLDATGGYVDLTTAADSAEAPCMFTVNGRIDLSAEL